MKYVQKAMQNATPEEQESIQEILKEILGN